MSPRAPKADAEETPELEVAAAAPAELAALAPEPAAPDRNTVEFWAEKLGMRERFLAPSGEFARPNPAYQDWAQARAYHAWPEGKELTEAEFMAAIETAKSHTFR